LSKERAAPVVHPPSSRPRQREAHHLDIDLAVAAFDLYVDFKTQERVPKLSVTWFREAIRHNAVVWRTPEEVCKMSGKFAVLTLASWLVLCSQGPTLAQSDKTQAPAQASTPPGAHAAVTALIPQPRSIHYGDSWLYVKGGFRVDWLGYPNSMLDRAVLRFQNDVARRTGLDVGRASAAQLRIECRGEDKGYLTNDARERYSLAVKDDAVVLTADGPAGVVVW
jgi:hypothetical protein